MQVKKKKRIFVFVQNPAWFYWNSTRNISIQFFEQIFLLLFLCLDDFGFFIYFSLDFFFLFNECVCFIIHELYMCMCVSMYVVWYLICPNFKRKTIQKLLKMKPTWIACWLFILKKNLRKAKKTKSREEQRRRFNVFMFACIWFDLSFIQMRDEFPSPIWEHDCVYLFFLVLPDCFCVSYTTYFQIVFVVNMTWICHLFFFLNVFPE